MVTTTRYLYHGSQYVAETDANGAVNSRYVNEPDQYTHLIGQREVSSGSSRTYHYDAVGSTREVTDDTEAVTDEFTYDAWGNRLSRSGTNDIPFQYVGERGYYRNEESGAYYVMARYYVPNIIRWLSRDPVELIERLYSYVNNSPSSLLDPSGLYPPGCTGNTPYPKCDAKGCPDTLLLNVDIYRWIGAKSANDLVKDYSCAIKRFRTCCINLFVNLTATKLHIKDHEYKLKTGVGSFFWSADYAWESKFENKKRDQSKVDDPKYYNPKHINSHYVKWWMVWSKLNGGWIIKEKEYAEYGWAYTPGNINFVRKGASVRTLAHEIGHNLSLQHVVDPGNLMDTESSPRGTDLTKDQCNQMRNRILSHFT